MLNSVNNYNVLGKLGPHYERPEYRPPAGGEKADQHTPAPAGDRRTLSGANKNGTKKPAPPPVPAPLGRLNPASARSLVQNLADQIASLPPWSTDREPHICLRTNLMTPVYV